MAKGYLVRSYIDKGKYFIDVNPFHLSDPENLQAYIKTQIQGFEEWQCSTHKTMREVRSAIMRVYGMGWFNRARARILELEVMGV